MGKVSIGLRGWRFDEEEVFTTDGEFRPLDEIPDDALNRLLRLTGLVEEPCDACYLEHGEEDKSRWRQATIVYGEPGDEVLLCDAHEADFLYWFREDGGSDLRGEERFRDAFHEWVVAGNRAPEGYGGLDHVQTDPDALPDPPDPEEVQAQLEAEADFEGMRIDLREALEEYQAERDDESADGDAAEDESADDGESGDGDPEAEAPDLDDLDLGQEYPSR